MLKEVMLRQKMKFIKRTRFTKIVPVLLLVVMLVAGTIQHLPITHAQSISDQIAELERQNASNRAAVADLRSQATSYQDAIKKLQAEIDALQGQINANTQEQNRLQNEITAAENELNRQKLLLGEDIRQMYLDGQISTIEMLASSKDLSEFVDKQQYRNSVQSKIKDTLDKITALKQQLRTQKEAVENLLEQQQKQQAQLSQSRSEQAQLLAYNQSQQADFNQRTKENQSKIDALIAAQRRANFNPDGGYYFIRFPGNVGGFDPNAYPYKNAGFGMSPGPGCVDNDGPDAWGYCTRQCVSYAAWAVVASGRSAPMFYGNARDWVSAAYSRGIPVYRTPQAGDIAISTAGYWGHAMYVQSVSGNTFTTSEYNTYLTGQLSYQTRSF